MTIDDESKTATLMAPSGPTPFSLGMREEQTTPVFGTRYEVLSLLGTGGMGTVYKARDRELDEIVALKVLRAEVVSTPGALDMFKREVKLARRVTHPNVARTFDIGESEGAKYLTMEFIEGTSLGRVLEWCGPFDVSRAIDVASQICAGLAAAHAVGVVHRDLKPENVLVRKNGALVLTDFGIARPVEDVSATATVGVPIGTPAYMAPEQVEALRDLDGRADIYALGVLLYELLTGELPFGGDTALAVASARLIKPPPDPRALRHDIPDAVAELVLRCMARDRDKRYAKAEDVLDALSRLTGPKVSERAPEPSLRSLETTKSVAVLPFRVAAGPDDAFTADGLLDDLIDGLSMTPGLRVRPRSSVSRFTDADRDPREIGQALGVDVVVEGSMRRQGDAVRVGARLLNVVDGFQLWAKRFERKSADLFSLSDDMAESIAAALTMNREVPHRDAPVDPIAMDLYLKGRVELRKAWGNYAEVAVRLFEAALERSPDDPTILASYAMAQIRAWFFGVPDSGPKARTAAERALALAPHLVDARHALALVKFHGNDAAGALVELKSVVEKSEYGPSCETLGTILAEIGLANEGRRQIERALRIDPESIFAHFELARQYALEGDWAKVDVTLSRMDMVSSTKNDGRGLRVRFSFWRGEVDEKLFEQLGPSVGPLPSAILAGAARGEVDKPLFRKSFAAAAKQGSARRAALMHQIEAEIAGSIGDADWALDAARLAFEGGLIDLAWLRACPLLGPLRAHPNYRSFETAVETRAAGLAALYRRR